MGRLAFYHVDQSYCNFLKSVDPCVPYVPEGEKEKRPFVGILLAIEDMKYYAPLYSPKPKHLRMRDDAIDFLKVNGGRWGVINFNNMIPIHESSLQRVETIILPKDTDSDRNYKTLVRQQQDWCNGMKEKIVQKATRLYGVVSHGHASPELMRRCCNFPILEREYRAYCIQHKLPSERSIDKLADRIAAAKETAVCRAISAKDRSKDERDR